MISLYQVNSQCMKVQHTDSHLISIDTFNQTEFKFVWNCAVSSFFCFSNHSTTASHTPGLIRHRQRQSGTESSEQQVLLLWSTDMCFMSHRRVSRILIFISGRWGVVPGELAEAGRPTPRSWPFSSSVTGQALCWSWRKSTVAARDEGALTWVEHGAARVEGGILGEKVLDELELFLFFL